MNTFPSERVKEDVFSVAISQTQDVAHHGHYSSRTAVRRATAVPKKTVTISFEFNPILNLNWTFSNYYEVLEPYKKKLHYNHN